MEGHSLDDLWIRASDGEVRLFSVFGLDLVRLVLVKQYGITVILKRRESKMSDLCAYVKIPV